VKGVKTFPKPLFDKIRSAIHHLNSTFDSEKVEEQVMDEYQIPKSEKQQAQEARVDLKQRDDLVTSRQRALILTHVHFFSKREDERKQKEAKERERMEKIKEKEEKKVAREKKKQEKAKEKEEKKIAREQKRAEKEAKKKDLAALKEQKRKETSKSRKKKRPRVPQGQKTTKNQRRSKEDDSEDDDFDLNASQVDPNLNKQSSAKIKNMLGICSRESLLKNLLD
jgi:hypothetical protein